MKLGTPFNKERFDRYREKIQERGIINLIDGIFVMQMEAALSAYYGSSLRAGWSILRRAITSVIANFYWRQVYRLCDKVGWTKIRQHPWMSEELKAKGYGERHGGHCDKLNCEDMNCVHRSIPRWYRVLTRMDWDDD